MANRTGAKKQIVVKPISKAELAEALGVKLRQIGNYIKDGMPIHSVGKRNAQMFDLKACQLWRSKNIDRGMASKTENIKPSIVDHEENLAEEEIKQRSDLSRKYTAEADDAELKVKLNRIKLAEAEGRLVDADDLDKAMAEQAIIHKTDKTNDEKILPILLENKTSAEIAVLLHEHQQERLEMLDKLINKKFTSSSSLFDIIEQALELLSYGVESDEIIKRMSNEV